MSDHAHRPPRRFAAESEFGSPAAAPRTGPDDVVPPSPTLVADSVVAPPLLERMQHAGGEPIGIVVEVRAAYPGGVARARDRVQELIRSSAGTGAPMWGSNSYLTTELTADQIRALVRADAEESPDAASTGPETGGGGSPRSSIHRIWPNFRSAR